jgi:hypothetical protein
MGPTMLDKPSGSIPVTDSKVAGVGFLGCFLNISIEGGEFEHAKLMISGPFWLTAPDGAHTLLDPAGEWSALTDVLALRYAALDALTISPESALRLVTTAGWAIEIPPDPKYESWELTLPYNR